MNDKIRSEHLKRTAYVYVRQSSLHQVRHHHEGRERQYELANRARQLGFAKTVVIDEDQGRSGSGLVDRPGFAELLAVVCRGEAGAVFALEASRLARNNRDWHHLIDLCGMTGTLIIDHDGIYDPLQLNDRLLLGLKGTMSEFELALFRQRAREAFERKIERGHAMWEVSVGFVRSEDDRLEKTPDRQVQQSIDGVFKKFRELGSARQTMLWYRDERIPLPHLKPGTAGREVVWRLPTDSRIRQVLKNPCYAGALAYGKTVTATVMDNGRVRKTRTQKRKPQDKWTVLILDNHPGYITWEEYHDNLKTLESNMAQREGNGGAAKRGAALLSSLLRCGRCGRKLFVAYSGKGGRTPRYACHGGRTDRGHASCLSLSGMNIERAVVEQVLEAVQPVGIKSALAAIDQAANQHIEKQQSLELALEKARYEAQRAQRQYDAVDPENRLVAGELESRWNVALSRVSGLEEELDQRKSERTTLTDEQQERLLELGSDLSKLWDDPTTSSELKKRVLRTVLHEIIINDDREKKEHHLVLHWQGGVHTELRVRRNGHGQRRQHTHKDAIELIRELSKVCSDQTIAATLNRLGYRTGAGKTWRVHSVYSTRWYHKLSNYRNSDEWLTIDQTAKQLGVSHTVIRRLIKQQKLSATQVVESTPWMIHRDALSSPIVQAEVAAVQCGRQLRRADPNQKELPLQ